METDTDYPIGKLDDITLYFLHYSNKQEAKEAWERRKERINFQNLYVILYEKDGVGNEDYEALKLVKCKKLIVIADDENSRYTFVKKIVKHNDGKGFDKDKSGIMTFEKQWDYVKWLNT